MEIGLILVVALIVIGPQKLPELAGQLARTIRDLQKTATDFSREITTPVQELKRDLTQPVRKLQHDLNRAVSAEPPDPYAHLASETPAIEGEEHATSSPTDDASDDTSAYASVIAEDEALRIDEANATPTPPSAVTQRVGLDQPEQAPELPQVRRPEGSVSYTADQAPSTTAEHPETISTDEASILSSSVAAEVGKEEQPSGHTLSRTPTSGATEAEA